jgi:hypothetical protein
MSIILLLALTTPSFSAFTEQDAANQKKIAQRAATAADSELPPCEGHKHLAEAIQRLAPSSGSCPKASEALGYYLKMSRQIGDNCREMTFWAEGLLRNPSYCEREKETQAVHRGLSELKKKAVAEDPEEYGKIDKLLDDPALSLTDLSEIKSAFPKSEFARGDCYFAVELAMQLRQRQRSLAMKNYGFADAALYDVCVDGPSGADDYLDFLRKGEDDL